MRSTVERLAQGVLDFLLPPRCVGCGVYGRFLCQRCQEMLPRLTPPFCHLCVQPLPEGDLCPRCQESPLALDGIRAPFLMEGVVREAIHKLKYQGLRAIAPVLGTYLAEQIKSAAIPGDALVPVPLHPRRERERGYNQASLLARQAGKLLGLPVLDQALVRLRPTPAQARSANLEQRRHNVEGAFQCRGGVKGLRIILVDDVCTTGSTLSACALALREAGAASVWGATLAREA